MRGKLLTTDDLIRSGACADGVIGWRNRLAPGVTALPVAKILKLCSQDERICIERAAGLSGYVDGYGDGYVDGYGDGYGTGNGYDDGDGYVDGYGYGYGEMTLEGSG